MLVMTSALSTGQWPEAPPSTAFNLNMTRLRMRRAPLSLQWEGERERSVCGSVSLTANGHFHSPTRSLSFSLSHTDSRALVCKSCFIIDGSKRIILHRIKPQDDFQKKINEINIDLWLIRYDIVFLSRKIILRKIKPFCSTFINQSKYIAVLSNISTLLSKSQKCRSSGRLMQTPRHFVAKNVEKIAFLLMLTLQHLNEVAPTFICRRVNIFFEKMSYCLHNQKMLTLRHRYGAAATFLCRRLDIFLLKMSQK